MIEINNRSRMFTAALIPFIALVISIPAEGAEKSVRPGVNKTFLDPGLDVGKWVGRFEAESRETFAERLNVVKALKLKRGDSVADIGAGTGYYAELFANEVGPDGQVYAIEIAPNFLKHINMNARKKGIDNITSVLGREDSITLGVGTIDLAYLCDTYHHFEYPQSSLASIHKALRPGGQLVVIDFDRVPGKSRQWVIDHMRDGKEVFIREIESAGFKLAEEVKIEGFKENFFLRFTKK